MAPILEGSEADDDFVRTISDADETFPLKDEDEDPSLNLPTKPRSNNKKRKRDVDERQIGVDTVVDGQQKKPKKDKKIKLVFFDERLSPEEKMAALPRYALRARDESAVRT